MKKTVDLCDSCLIHGIEVTTFRTLRFYDPTVAPTRGAKKSYGEMDLCQEHFNAVLEAASKALDD